ncbi:carotenoid 1,2-hydratase [Actinomadura macrotermitis]|nr:carotenoid 1,2-hydratase [Actinomadura macrotermitis]
MIKDHRGRRAGRRLLALWAAFAVALTLPVAASASTPGVSIPKDESPHNTAREWWYYTGHLDGVDSRGKRRSYGFEQVFFRNRIQYPTLEGYAANLAVTDLTGDGFKWETRTAGQPDNLPAGGGYDIAVQDWNMAGKSGQYRLGGGFQDGSYKLALNLEQRTPPALHGEYKDVKGLIDYAQWGESFYYSYTNLKTTGTIWDHGEPIKVTGTSWFDHQYGDFTRGYGSWDWFSVQLTNGTQYMVYLIKDRTGVVRRTGTLVRKDGSTVNLPAKSLYAEALGTWKSPVTGLSYSSGWKVHVPGGCLTIKPRRLDQEVAWEDAPGGGYWEGDSSVTGTIDGDSVTGRSYVEITTPDDTF